MASALYPDCFNPRRLLASKAGPEMSMRPFAEKCVIVVM